MSANFSELLRKQAAERPAEPALIVPLDGEKRRVESWRTVSFGELDELADRYAHGLRAHGAKQGDRVLFLVRPSVEFYAALFALLRLGAVPVLIDPGMGIPRVLQCVEQIRPSVVVAIPLVHAIRTFAPKAFRSAHLNVTAGRRLLWGGPTLDACLADPGEPFAPADVTPGDDALIAFTSGSTGPAKGVVFTHGMFAEQSTLLAARYEWQPGQRMVMCFAAFVLFTVGAGLTTILPAMNMSKPATARPERIVEAANEHHAELAFASPIVWMNLVRVPDPDLRLTSVQQVITTGAPIAEDLHTRLLARLPEGAALHTPYGATEALPLCTIDSAEILSTAAALSRKGHGTCVGRAFDGVSLEIIRVTDEPIATWSDDLRVEPGQVGEIVASGAMVSPSYKDLDEANAGAKIDRSGVRLHRMGDLGYVDEQGRLWFCGRKSHRLETSSGMVPPVPVENVFNQHPEVFRTALVGVGDRGAQMPVLCVEMEAGKRFGPEVAAELAVLLKGSKWQGVVDLFLAHAGFPVDPRHNSKIKREVLADWAADQVRRGRGEKGKAAA